ncbi:897_t:CDS:10 [Acaulospora morrowiae]|uniref:897_t:CDS:1 n=1 Tax=Acaulospora morrowiae TaxID=94023 RepID=A0A9N8VEM9_9GLOM|nr:897_t:CDS:10 [Acaulospora morrowiae]
MKFGKVLQHEIEDIPSEWRPFLIQYKTHKKCILKIVQELNEIGMSHDILKEMFKAAEGYKLEYTFASDKAHVRPCIKLDLDDCEHISKSQLSTFTQLAGKSHASFSKYDNCSVSTLSSTLSDDSETSATSNGFLFDDHHSEQVTDNEEVVVLMEKFLKKLPMTLCIELESDGEFFDILFEEISQLNRLQQKNQEQFCDRLEKLRPLLIDATSPYKADMYVWREILQLYTQAEIFFGNIETDRKARSYEVSQEQFDRFVEELNKHRLQKKLRNPSSKIAFEEFIKLNRELVAMKHFQFMNQVAMSKILKKHDKKTCLSASSNFQKLTENAPYLNDEITTFLHNALIERFTSTILLIEDYLCPICISIHWKPVRLRCRHVFCIRCLVKAEREGMKDCPICRAKNAIKYADSDNIDTSLMNLLKLYFPREVKQKQTDNEREKAIEDMEILTGRRYDQCAMM